jgi:hypothetical protein
MQRFLPSLWLLAAALYATVALFLEHALYEKALMAQVAAHETRQGRSSRPSCSRKASTSGSGRLAPLCGRDRLPPHHSSGLSDPAWR